MTISCLILFIEYTLDNLLYLTPFSIDIELYTKYSVEELRNLSSNLMIHTIAY